jgi:putative redox protein
MEFKMKEKGFIADLPYGELHVSGNDEYGYRPYQLLVSSIAVCSGGVLKTILEKMRMKVEDISVKTDVERNVEEANRVDKIHLHFVLRIPHADKDKVEKAIHLANKNCPMVQSVKGSIDIVESYELI